MVGYGFLRQTCSSLQFMHTSGCVCLLRSGLSGICSSAEFDLKMNGKKYMVKAILKNMMFQMYI